MKKRILSILLAGVMVALAGCTSGVAQEDYDAIVAELDALKEQLEESKKTDDEAPTASIPSVEPSDAPEPSENPSIEPSEEPSIESSPELSPPLDSKANGSEDFEAEFYSYDNGYGSQYAFLIVTNNTNQTVEIEGALKVFNSSGDIVGAQTSSEGAVGAGQTTILTYLFDEEFSRSEYEISAYPDEYGEPVTQNLSYESSSASDKEIVTVTNNGTIPAEFVEVYVLFFNGETLVSHEWTYFTDNDSELKPGRSITEEMDCRQDYDSILVFFTGRG